MLTHATKRSWVTYFLFFQLFLILISFRNYYSSISTSSDISDRESSNTNVIRISKSKKGLNNLKKTLIESKEHIQHENFIETKVEQHIASTKTSFDIVSKLGTSSIDIKTKIGMLYYGMLISILLY